MKITVFGSTGPTGREVIKQALEAGYEVVAYARSDNKLRNLQHEKLQVVKGDLADRNAIGRALDGTDAVISLLGPKGNVKDTELSDGIQSIIEMMKTEGVKRLISLSTGSVKDKRDRFDLTYKILVSLIKTTVRGAYNEIVRAGELIRLSGLDWTLVRVGFLNNHPVLPLKVGYYGHGIVKAKISRASIAKFMLDQVVSKLFINQSPAISN